MRQSAMCCVVGVMMVCGLVSRAHADEFVEETTAFESQHHVDVRVIDGAAFYRVRRVFSNAHTSTAQAIVYVEKPPGASVVGLRLLSADGVYTAEHLGVSEAEDMYVRPAGDVSAPEVRPRVMMSQHSDQRDLLKLYPLHSGESMTIEYDMIAPAPYHDGAHHISYAHATSTSGLVQPSIRVMASDPDQRITFMGTLSEPGEVITPTRRDIRARSLCQGEAWLSTRCHVMQARVDDYLSKGAQLDVTFDFDGAVPEQLRLMWVPPSGESRELELELTADGRLRARVEALPVSVSAGVWSLLVLDSSPARSSIVNHAVIHAAGKERARFDHAQIQSLQLGLSPRHAQRDSLVELSLSAPTSQRDPVTRYTVLHHDTQSVMHMAFELPLILSTLPEDLDVSIVWDTSRSMDTLERDQAVVSIIEALGDHAPDGTFDVVTFDREARNLFAAPVKGTQLAAALAEAREREPISYRNGSNLDQGVALASARLASSSHETRRILVLTDELLPADWAGERELDGLAKGVMLQVVRLSSDIEPSLTVPSPEGASDLGRYVRRHGGVYFEMVLGIGEDVMALRALSLGLLRPIFMDLIETDHPQLTALPRQLGERQGVSVMQVIDGHDVPERWTLQGALWSSPVELTFAHDPRLETRAAALVLADAGAQITLSSGFEEVLSTMSGAVSRHHSLIAVKRADGASLSSAPMLLSGFGFGGLGSYSCGGTKVSRRAKAWPMSTPVKQVVAQCVAKVGVMAWAGEVGLAQTYHEIVQVEVRGDDPRVDACVSEEIWMLELPMDHFGQQKRSNASWRVVYAGSDVSMTSL